MNRPTNITFFLGAGASYSACPILKEQGEKMLELARNYLKLPNENFDSLKGPDLNEKQKLAWNIGYFGSKAIEFGTIDTYAKKLKLNSSDRELAKLKLAVSTFFTIWQLTDDKILKSRNGIKYDFIDKRYITLMAAILESVGRSDFRIKNNIRFVSWNYDLQVEHAFKAFYGDHLSWSDISRNLSFQPDKENKKQLDICHLNGYHGFYQTNSNEIDFMNRTSLRSIDGILEELSYLFESLERKQISLTNHINYAWEQNPLANRTRDEAMRIFHETDMVIIVGYSFPNFNKEIDSLLFKKLEGRKTKIYIQDPNASLSFISQLVNKDDCEIVCENIKMDNFYLPYEF